MRWVVVLFVAACGRLGFDPLSGGDGGGDDATAPDGNRVVACIDGDGACPSSCVGQDSDCVTTCGDGRCVGNAGELCATCDVDCNTASVVCGNSACEPSEDSATCYADCGPEPWMWVAEEDAFFARLNQGRIGGTDCPGMGGPTTAPPLERIGSLDLGARERAWEMAKTNTGGGCNGRSVGELLSGAGGSGNGAIWIALGSGTVQDTADFFFGDAGVCPSIMDPTLTRIGVGVASGVTNGYAIYLD